MTSKPQALILPKISREHELILHPIGSVLIREGMQCWSYFDEEAILYHEILRRRLTGKPKLSVHYYLRGLMEGSIYDLSEVSTFESKMIKPPGHDKIRVLVYSDHVEIGYDVCRNNR